MEVVMTESDEKFIGKVRDSAKGEQESNDNEEDDHASEFVVSEHEMEDEYNSDQLSVS